MFNYTTIEESKIEFVEIAPAAELPNGERLFVDLGDKPIVIFNIAGQFFAIGDVCTPVSYTHLTLPTSDLV